jgi:hypothetical protein
MAPTNVDKRQFPHCSCYRPDALDFFAGRHLAVSLDEPFFKAGWVSLSGPDPMREAYHAFGCHESSSHVIYDVSQTRFEFFL